MLTLTNNQFRVIERKRKALQQDAEQTGRWVDTGTQGRIFVGAPVSVSFTAPEPAERKQGVDVIARIHRAFTGTLLLRLDRSGKLL